ncbi:SAM-dependent methyltransferase [Tumidithrix elongata RA019]|uniref:SAM-dependent methyltransferase n=1 Tax=Tumidithrix elongata BACA0141 TaxID=2716417 RepID=A0AAW9Q3T0_9CYAN|nr:SAM-dependent methyltransferase [Tumidithrix elongata RA019]
MGLKLANVVPWGRSLPEYIKMFALSDRDLSLSILDCAAGPASFNAELTHKGGNVISCDPIYQFGVGDIAKQIDATYTTIIQQVSANLDRYVWRDIDSPAQLGQVRMSAMGLFLEDFPKGLQNGRYMLESLPQLSFATQQFDLALCSHFLFAYSKQLSETFHYEAIAEMCRVAKEVRIFPLLTISGEPSPYLHTIIETLTQQGYQPEIQSVNYEFQRGGNQMLKICKPLFFNK